jgi:YD repeat-containing protein
VGCVPDGISGSRAVWETASFLFRNRQYDASGRATATNFPSALTEIYQYDANGKRAVSVEKTRFRIATLKYRERIETCLN